MVSDYDILISNYVRKLSNVYVDVSRHIESNQNKSLAFASKAMHLSHSPQKITFF